jgi:pSer/pThr/pTyr-binding forkhead associated (FHA) protein
MSSSNQGQVGPAHSAPEPREVTRLESDEEIRQALEARRARLASTGAGATGAPAKVPTPEPVQVEVQPELPVLRPPVGLLCVLDDGKPDGEWFRLRADRLVIGRTEGDVLIPHDGLISGRHAEIVRQHGPGGYRWVLVDLQSTNGTFVRVGSTLLRDEAELLIGRGRYRFEAGAAPASEAAAPVPGAPPATTQAWSNEPVRTFVPSLVEITPAGPLQRFTLTLPEYWIGRDPQHCAIVRPDDPLTNGRHARLYRNAKGQWYVENNKSVNGLWLRITEPMPLGSACRFRLGEQQFIFRVKQ